ncbi:AraC family transcriptional regulator N-terminal domain-containing protein [Pseudomonas veronii]|jgi:AraC-like DNA-binding protein|uniref:AraC family transcriptional regulator n=1 Tax=Pseudomonas veronii TaxID=76761 RepID=A0A7Y1F1H5_PSEVE|nr:MULTISPECIES: AraC family transcriptional regulator [Pseudomonas]SEC40890.1 AraC-type DNA-binding protein [Pseudomonas marginalis]AQY66376.1 AraC family transcriptional regulator [Pseudomonas veronii]KRP81122.1 AraC family transcriptional regulator [Pseudomonas veronii]MCT8960813.1 AraC family transcriptional regulator [Pseudomonas veronii]MCT9827455.1 AraC family transcriptional regulator [Pseudomonas veronii]
MNRADSRTSRMVHLMETLAPVEGYNLSTLEDIRFLRSNRPLTRTPVLYDPGIVILCQGRKRGYLGDDVYVYDAQHYLVVSVPVPFTMETDASEAQPMLAVYMRLDLQMASELILQMDEALGPSDAQPKGMYASPMDDLLRASTLRFLEAMSSPGEAQILGPSLVREIYYRILTGEQGGSMRAALNRQGHFGKVTRAIRKIHSCYQERLDVVSLAQEASMSVPNFHLHFRSVTDSSPMQYLKSTRLHQARLLMLRNAMTASTAAFNVGYESASQFSREFKRFFGRTPQAEIEWMKATYALPAPSTPSMYVSSH